MSMQKKAVVLLSGGLDSSTVLYYALEKGFQVFTLSFAYKQKHVVELHSARALAAKAGVKNYELEIDFSLFGHSALTDNIEVPKGGHDLGKENFIPVTYVPARNLVFLSLASALAESLQAQDIFIGVNSLDYSGYPDCRPDFIESFRRTVNLATRVGRETEGFQVHTPLLYLSKKEIVEEAFRLRVPLELTWSCYAPVVKDGKTKPCGQCDSCLLRAQGFADASKEDAALEGIVWQEDDQILLATKDLKNRHECS